MVILGTRALVSAFACTQHTQRPLQAPKQRMVTPAPHQQHPHAQTAQNEVHGSSPRTSRNFLAMERPSMVQEMVVLFSWGTTRVRIGASGLYLAIRLAVRPLLAYTTISPACSSRGDKITTVGGGVMKRVP